MIDARQMLDKYLGADAAGQIDSHVKGLTDKARANPMAATAIAGGLAALLLGTKSGKKLGKSALRMGGMAAIAGLAYKAYQSYQANQTQAGQPAPASPSESDFLPAPREEADRAQALIVAMIQAAKADGFIDAEERERIAERVDALQLGAEELDFLRAEMNSPLDIEKVVRSSTGPEVAMELYVASAVAVDPDHPAERAYLNMLAARLGLDPQLVANLDETIAEARG